MPTSRVVAQVVEFLLHQNCCAAAQEDQRVRPTLNVLQNAGGRTAKEEPWALAERWQSSASPDLASSRLSRRSWHASGELSEHSSISLHKKETSLPWTKKKFVFWELLHCLAQCHSKALVIKCSTAFWMLSSRTHLQNQKRHYLSSLPRSCA